MNKYCLGILLFVICIYAYANNLVINDYAKGIKLITENQASIYKLSLPEQIYRDVTKADMSDVRVFNQANEAVPHIIKKQHNDSETSLSLELPYFPLPFDEVKLLDDQLDISVSSEGKVIRIQSDNNVSDVNKVAKYYLIDASHIEHNISSIDFKIGGAHSAFAKKIQLEVSDNLNNWKPLVRKATLTDLEYGNHKLKKMRVDLPSRKIKYLRFSWLDDAGSLVINSIKANFIKENLVGEKSWAIAKLVNKDTEQAVYEFDTNGLFSIEQINLEIPQDNSLIDVVIESRANGDSDWSYRFSGVFYKLYFNDIEVTRDPVNIRPVKHRYWRIKLKSTDGIGNAVPSLKFAWRANELYFLARGQGPYILAYGNANITSDKQSSSQLLEIINNKSHSQMVSNAIFGEEIELKGDAALIKKMELPWQRILLWFVLIFGVALIAVMAYRLIKQMGMNTPPT